MRYLLTLLPLVLLAGCDPGFGVSRRAQVSFLPAPAMVSAAIRQTPGVDDVDYRFTKGGYPLTWTGIHSPDQIHTFIYRGGSNVSCAVQFVVDYKGKVEYSQGSMWLGRPPPQRWVDATYPVVLQIESRLEKDCGLTNLSAKVHESVVGVKIK